MPLALSRRSRLSFSPQWCKTVETDSVHTHHFAVQAAPASIMRRFIQGLLVALLVVTATLAPPRRAIAQDPIWSPPMDISAESLSGLAVEKSWFPDIVTDSAGGVHVVWASSAEEYDTVVYAYRSPDGEWTKGNDIQAMLQSSGTEASRPGLLYGKDEMLHVSFRDTRILYSSAPAVTAYDPRSWAEPVMINEGYFSDLVEDADGTMHMVYTDNVDSERCPICFHLFYTYLEEGGNWSEAVDISRLTAGTAKPQMWLDANNTLHVVYESGIGGSYGGLTSNATVMYVASDNLGKSWRQPLELDPQRGEGSELQARNIALAQDRNGDLIVVWQSIPDDIIYFQRSIDNGITWSQPAQIPNVYGVWELFTTRLDIYSMATDAKGTVHLVLAGRPSLNQKTADLMHLSWDGSSWSRARAIANYSGDEPEWPRIAVGLGNQLHVVWFVREEEHIFSSDQGRYQVFYSNAILPIPGDAPIALATLPPTPVLDIVLTPTVTPTPTETPVPISALTLVSSPPDALIPTNIRSENDEMMILALAAIPALLLVAMVFVFARRGKG